MIKYQLPLKTDGTPDFIRINSDLASAITAMQVATDKSAAYSPDLEILFNEAKERMILITEQICYWASKGTGTMFAEKGGGQPPR